MLRDQKLEAETVTVMRGVRVVDALFYDPCPSFVLIGQVSIARELWLSAC